MKASDLSLSGKNVALAALAEAIKFLSVHDTKTPIGWTTEPKGGSPEYTRKPAKWSRADNGTVVLVGVYAWDIPPGFTVRSVGLWSAPTGGVFYGYFDVVDEIYSGQGVHTLTSGSISL